MRNNRIFALCFRFAAFALCLLGILDTLGAFRGAIWWSGLLYYTTQSNLLVLAMFGALSVRTALAIGRDGAKGDSSFFERLSAIVALSIAVTFLLYWALLAPLMLGPGLLAFGNLQVHGITPLLMIFDYLFFSERGKLKRRDPWFFAIIPLAYFAQSTAIGFLSKTPVYYSGRFPYFFIDFDKLGVRVFVYLAVFTAFFLGVAFLLLKYDGRKKRP
ncbi:MAG: Pr6Pr family membrane protein [Oscillospiraceae bacterium]|jgi:hypothetical protein|nr:Pr6Pr family membrane protein [Oscillospiraceae bacterium]